MSLIRLPSGSRCLLAQRQMEANNMQLVDLNFSTMMPCWTEATRVGTAWFPTPCGSMESGWITHQGSQLLSATALYIRQTAPTEAHMEEVRRMIMSESNRPGATLGALARHDNP